MLSNATFIFDQMVISFSIFRNVRLVHRFILCLNYMVFPFVLYPQLLLKQCIAIFVVVEGWLLLDIGWFVLFFQVECILRDFVDLQNSNLGWDPINRFKHTQWVAVVTQTDPRKSVYNHCKIDLLWRFYVVALCVWIFYWFKGFVL